MSDDDDSAGEAPVDKNQRTGRGGLREDAFGKILGGRPTKVAKLASSGPQKGQLGVFDYMRAAASAKSRQGAAEQPAITLNANVSSSLRFGIEQAPSPSIESPSASAITAASEAVVRIERCNVPDTQGKAQRA